MPSKRTIATDISSKVRAIVTERDKYCIFCGLPYNLQVAHYIPRSAGGLGIKENLTLACISCHHDLDQSAHRKEMLVTQRKWLDKHYPEFPDELRKYRK